MGREVTETEAMGEIDLFVGVPDCAECRRKINDLLMEMGCWVKIEIGYPALYGTRVRLAYRDSEPYDYWEKGKEAKEILKSYQYRVL